jgi:hypothetical protein
VIRPRSFLLAALIAAAALVSGPARADRAPPAGARDFDFNIGKWKTRIRRVLDPFAAGTNTMELQGTVAVRKIWDGALLEEIEADGPKGHWQGLTFFLFNPKTRQWSQFFANARDGVLQPPSVGEFKDGRGELVSADTFDGRGILVRSVWSRPRGDTHRFEELYSADTGKTWRRALTADLSRLSSGSAEPRQTRHDGSHDFDFELGTWRIETKRMVKPLTGSTEWSERRGQVKITPVWGGKGNFVHLLSDGPRGHVEMAALRLYNPGARQWRIHFATPRDGMLGPPLIGEFKGGRGVFYDQETFGARTIWVRFTVFPVSPDVTQSEQAFSDDQGKTWETNQISRSTRIRG